MKKILIACERSGNVRNAFRRLGFEAYSCDLVPADDNSRWHITDDAVEVAHGAKWDLMIAHPPCTRLCNSGVRWLTKPPPGKTLTEMFAELDDGARLFSELWNAPIERIAIENPVMHKHAKRRIRNYTEFTQSVQPWQFAESETSPDYQKKRTCFWLKGLEPLKPTNTLDGAKAGSAIHFASPGPERGTLRSKTFEGMATAMATQWGNQLLNGIKDHAENHARFWE